MNPVNYDRYREQALQLRTAEVSRQLDRLLAPLTRWRRSGERQPSADCHGARPQMC